MYRFLLTSRWLGQLAVAVLVAAACVLLGMWQWDRGQERRADNQRLQRNLAAPVAEVSELMTVRRETPAAAEHRRVRVTGEYDPGRTLLVRLRPHEGRVGFFVLVPLVGDDGTALLVNRGWIPPAPDGGASDVPQPPSGEVTVVARVRASEPASTTGTPPAGQVSRIHLPTIARDLPYPVYRGYGDLVSERPAPEKSPARVDPPEPSVGPNFAYAVQWWLFAGLALGAYVVLARREARR